MATAPTIDVVDPLNVGKVLHRPASHQIREASTQRSFRVGQIQDDVHVVETGLDPQVHAMTLGSQQIVQVPALNVEGTGLLRAYDQHPERDAMMERSHG